MAASMSMTTCTPYLRFSHAIQKSTPCLTHKENEHEEV